MKSLSATLSRRGFSYLFLLTAVVILGGGAGIYGFEHKETGGLKTYGDAIWSAAMIVITLGSEFWPRTTEGRILCCMIALYGFAILGYITATLASFFIDKDSRKKSETPPANELTA